MFLQWQDGLLQNNCEHFLHSTDKPRLTSKILCNSIKNLAHFRSAFHLHFSSVVRSGSFQIKVIILCGILQRCPLFRPLGTLFLIYIRLRGDFSSICPGFALSWLNSYLKIIDSKPAASAPTLLSTFSELWCLGLCPCLGLGLCLLLCLLQLDTDSSLPLQSLLALART